MILTTRTIGFLVTAALVVGGATWGMQSLITLAGGAGSDYGLDTDGNGTFEWLVVEAEISLPQAGTWDVYADLSTETPPPSGACDVGRGPPLPPVYYPDSTPRWTLAWAYERYFFPAGAQTVRMAFAGTDIARAGVDGPYAVHAALSLGGYPYGGIRMPEPVPSDGFLEWNYTTRPYAASDFEPPFRSALFTGAHADSAVDVDADGLADFLELTADVHVIVDGRFTLHGMLTDRTDPDAWRTVAYAYREFEATTADMQVFLRFPGDQIRQARVDGPWDFILTLYGPVEDLYLRPGAPDGIFVRPGHFVYPETLCGTTEPYHAADFDDTMELLRYTGRFEESTPDHDEDGLHDALIVRAEVDVFVTASFDVSGVLRPESGSTSLSRTTGQVWLREGLGWVDFVFSGPDIRASGVDGPYEATLSLTPSERGIDPMTTYLTEAYRAVDFEEGVTSPRPYWISNLTAAVADSSLTISVSVVRGNDLLTRVMEDTLEVVVTDGAGSVVGYFKAEVYLPGGGSEQSFSFTIEGLSAGTYTIAAIIGPPDHPVDARRIVVTL
jgi:hypothetical protein